MEGTGSYLPRGDPRGGWGLNPRHLTCLRQTVDSYFNPTSSSRDSFLPSTRSQDTYHFYQQNARATSTPTNNDFKRHFMGGIHQRPCRSCVLKALIQWLEGRKIRLFKPSIHGCSFYSHSQTFSKLSVSTQDNAEDPFPINILGISLSTKKIKTGPFTAI